MLSDVFDSYRLDVRLPGSMPKQRECRERTQTAGLGGSCEAFFLLGFRIIDASKARDEPAVQRVGRVQQVCMGSYILENSSSRKYS